MNITHFFSDNRRLGLPLQNNRLRPVIPAGARAPQQVLMPTEHQHNDRMINFLEKSNNSKKHLSVGPSLALALLLRPLLGLERVERGEGGVSQHGHGGRLAADPALGGQLAKRRHGVESRHLPNS